MRGSYDNIGRIIVVQFGDAAVFPQLFRDADDVVGKVDEFWIEPFHDPRLLPLRITNRERQAARNPGLVELPEARKNVYAQLLVCVEQIGLPPLKWSSAMFRKTEETHGKQATEARRDCHEVTAG